MALSIYSLDKSQYYKTYYINYRDKILNKYYEKKEQKLKNDKLYESYGGEIAYYKQSLINLGFLIIIKEC